MRKKTPTTGSRETHGKSGSTTTGRNKSTTRVSRDAGTGQFKASAKMATKKISRQGTLKASLVTSFGPVHALRGDTGRDPPVKRGPVGGGRNDIRHMLGFEDVVQPRKTEEPLLIEASHPPVHPGEILREEFMAPEGLTAYAIAKACKIPRSKVERIVREDLGISGDTAVRLGRFFGNSPQFWMNLQATYEVMKASQELGDAVNEIEPYKQVDKSAL